MDEQAATVVIGSLPCRTEPEVLAFAIPRVADDAVAPDYAGPPGFVLSISVDPVLNDGSVDGINRALILVGLAGTPQPDRSALLATFVGAFGTETLR